MSTASGALTQIAALGPQNVHLNCNPQYSLFKGGYRRHTNFAIATQEQCFQQVGFGRTMCAKIERNGDAISEVYLTFQLPAIVLTDPAAPATGAPFAPAAGDGAHYTNSVGYAVIEEADVRVGGHEFDKRTGEYHELWEELRSHEADRLREMTGYSETVAGLIDLARRTQFIYAPLQFWFNVHRDQALPLIALQYHEVQIRIKTRALRDLGIELGGFVNNTSLSTPAVGAAPTLDDAMLLINYVFLDTAERRMFATSTHEYLIQQLQYNSAESHTSGISSQRFHLNFNHPLQGIYWYCLRNAVGTPEDVVREDTPFQGNDHFNWSGRDAVIDTFPGSGIPLEFPTDPFLTAQLTINGHDRTGVRASSYYRNVTSWERHSSIPKKFQYAYLFALHPEHWRPSGSLNGSRIDNIDMNMTFPTSVNLAWSGIVRFFGLNHNMIKLCSGMAGLLYAN